MRWARGGAIAACLVGAFGVVSAGGAQAQDGSNFTEREGHGDWKVLCDDTDRCFMSQGQSDEDGGSVLMQLRPLKEPIDVNGVPHSAEANVIVPLGVLLTRGVLLQIDEAENNLNVGFERCAREGCRVKVLFEEAYVTELKAGSKLRVHVLIAAGQPTRIIEFSLAGFTAAFDSLL